MQTAVLDWQSAGFFFLFFVDFIISYTGGTARDGLCLPRETWQEEKCLEKQQFYPHPRECELLFPLVSYPKKFALILLWGLFTGKGLAFIMDLSPLAPLITMMTILVIEELVATVTYSAFVKTFPLWPLWQLKKTILEEENRAERFGDMPKVTTGLAELSLLPFLTKAAHTTLHLTAVGQGRSGGSE